MIDPKERFKMLVAVHFVLMRDDQVLLGRRQNTGWSDGLFALFGGHMEEGELALGTLAREAQEELGIKIDLSLTKLKHVRNILRLDHTRLHLYFVVTRWDGEITLKEPELCSEIGWFDSKNLPKDVTKDAGEILSFIQKDIYYSETTQNE